jgi:HEAT repeat protein/PBS lyase HEAT-like repeat-containing protein
VALNDEKPWVRDIAVTQLGKFKSDSSVASKLTEIAANDKAYRVRGAALKALAETKSPNSLEALSAAVKTESPDDTIRDSALEALGLLGDDRAVPILLEWSAPGKPLETRTAAIGGVAGLDKSNKEITKALISYLQEPYFNVKFSALYALGSRGDQDAIGPLEALLKSGDLSIGAAPFIESQISALKAQAGDKSATKSVNGGHEAGAGASSAAAANENASVVNALQKLQTAMDEVNTRLSKIESQLNDSAKK